MNRLDLLHYGGYLLLAVVAKIGTDMAVMKLRDTPANTPESLRWSKIWHAWGWVLTFSGASAAAFAYVGRYGLQWLAAMLLVGIAWTLLFDVGLNLARRKAWDYVGIEAGTDRFVSRIFPASFVRRVPLSAGALAVVAKVLALAAVALFYFSHYNVQQNGI